MTLTEYRDIEQRSPEWDDLRRGMVTASAIGALLTPTLRVAGNDTSRALIASLAAERITGRTEPGYISADMWRGIEHEPYAVAAYEARTGSKVDACGFMVRELNAAKVGFSPDGLVDEHGLIEVKCPRAKGHIQTVIRDEVPSVYMAQIQAGLYVSGRKWADYVSFHGGLPLYVKRVTPDADWFAAILQAAMEAEASISAVVATYTEATKGLPATERVPDYDEIEV